MPGISAKIVYTEEDPDSMSSAEAVMTILPSLPEVVKLKVEKELPAFIVRGEAETAPSTEDESCTDMSLDARIGLPSGSTS